MPPIPPTGLTAPPPRPPVTLPTRVLLPFFPDMPAILPAVPITLLATFPAFPPFNAMLPTFAARPNNPRGFGWPPISFDGPLTPPPSGSTPPPSPSSGPSAAIPCPPICPTGPSMSTCRFNLVAPFFFIVPVPEIVN